MKLTQNSLKRMIKEELAIVLSERNMTNTDRPLDIEFVMPNSGYKPANPKEEASASDMGNRQYKISKYYAKGGAPGDPEGYRAMAKDVTGKTWVKMVPPEKNPNINALAAELQKLEFAKWEALGGDIVDLGTYDSGGSPFR